jgi:RNA polymerase sigma-70 factor (ECF subfamily)
VLILRDVLGFHAREVAQVLDSTEESVTSALKRARATLQRRLPRPGEREQPPAPGSASERELVERFTRAFEAKDVHGIVALLTEDVWLTMPPLPLEYQGPGLAARFLTATAFRPGWTARLIPARANGQPAFALYARDPDTGSFYTVGLMVLTLTATATRLARPRLVATRDNGQPAFGIYVRDPQAPILHAAGLLVLTLAGNRICAMTRFDTSMLAYFGLPRTLPD